MDDINPNDLAAPCGIYCAACRRYSGTRICRGCRMDSRHNKCDIYECCVAQSGRKFCYQCEYFPCERLREFTRSDPGTSFAHHRHIAIENLVSIRENGLENWVESMDRHTRSGEYAINRRNDDGMPDESPCPCKKNPA